MLFRSGHASRGYGRVNYLSTGEPNPMQEDLDALFQNQEIIMSDYISWASSRESGSEILNEKRIKELVKEAFSECQADFMLQHAKAARLESANRQALEELMPRLLQILLHAEPPALLFY